MLGKILIVDDDVDVLQAARLLLKRHARLVHTEKRPAQIPALLQNQQYDVILLDMNFTRDVSSGREGFFWLDKILEIEPSAVVVLITAFGDVEMAVRGIKAGATDFVLKPWQNEKLIATLMSALSLKESKVQADRFRSQSQQLSQDLGMRYRDFIGEAPAMQTVYAQIQKVAATDANVLILGDNGTGKELVARALHRHSKRRESVFVTVDVASINQSLFQSELFGHVKGAFTDARDDRAGRFEVASGGTLFLDEIGNLPLEQQANLLTVLERREVIRVGSNRPQSIDVRLICATNKPINELVRDGSFRQDLLYRINTVEIHLPLLKERTTDIPILAAHFLENYSRKYNDSVTGISAGAIAKLQRYTWPGNVRELEHMIERAVIMTDETVLQPEDFLFTERHTNETAGVVFDSYNLDEVEKLIIRKAIDKHEGNISRAAGELGLTRASLYRRLEKYEL
ncbi:MAG: sigma-54-dependent Fis family transcriptional regulator [Bacteroidetes bacterium]|nr:MAG: sigma-54-dependent Fis family transcriptional regulator [Bacteroidota bacterium]